MSVASTADIELTSSQHDDGVCIGDRVIFTCNVTGIGIVQWAVESLNTLSENNIIFRIHEDEPGSVLVQVLSINLPFLSSLIEGYILSSHMLQFS